MCCREYCSNMMQYVWYLWGSGRGQKGGEIDETEMELFPRIPIPLNPPYFIWEIYRFSSKNFTFHKTWQTKYKGPFWIHWAFFGVLLGRTSFAFVISSILLVFRRNVFSFNFDHFNHHRHLLLIVIITFLVRLSSDFSLEVLDLEHGDAGNYICEVDHHHCYHHHHHYSDYQFKSWPWCPLPIVQVDVFGITYNVTHTLLVLCKNFWLFNKNPAFSKKIFQLLPKSVAGIPRLWPPWAKIFHWGDLDENDDDLDIFWCLCGKCRCEVEGSPTPTVHWTGPGGNDLVSIIIIIIIIFPKEFSNLLKIFPTWEKNFHLPKYFVHLPK